jgi:DNA-binding PadR family transcriptional regulator
MSSWFRKRKGWPVSLRHGLLGLLAERPASGYDLTQRFEKVVGPVWPAKHPQIYAELGRMATEGLIRIESEGPRGRKAYEITDAGLAEVRRWLVETNPEQALRFEPLLRSFFFWLMEPDELAAHLERESASYRKLADTYREYGAAKDRGDFGFSPQTQSLRVAVEAGARIYTALADWAQWAAERSRKQ